MVGFAQSFWAGVNDSRASRSEMANAFAQFRAANPHATLAEMQSFIDQMAGGNNYLRGGMPSGAVLQGIAQQNQQAAAYERAKNAQALMQQQLQTQSMLQTAAEQALIASNFDIGKANQIFQQTFGGNTAGLPVGGLLTPENAQRIQTNMLMEVYPKAQSLLTGMMTDGKKPSLADMKRMFPGLPDAVLDQMADRAVADFQAEQQTRKAEIRTRVINNNSQILQQAETIIAANPEASYETVRDELINWLGFSESPEDYPDDLIQGFYNNAQENHKRRLDEDAAKLQAEKDAKYSEAYLALMQDPTLQTLILGEGVSRDAKALKHIERVLSGAVGKDVPPGAAQEILEAAKEVAAENMRIRQGEAALQVSAQVAAIPSEIRSQNAEEAEKAGERYNLPDQSMPTWEALAQEYYVTPEMGQAFVAVWNELSPDERENPDILRASAEAEFAARGVQRIDNVVSRKQDEYTDSMGAREVVTFSEYLTDVRGDLAENTEFMQTKLDTILEDQSSASRVARLQAFREEVANAAELAARLIEEDAMDRHRWLDPRTRWDQGAIDLQIEAYGKQAISYIRRIDQLIEKAEQEELRMKTADEAALGKDGADQALSGERTPAELAVGGAVDKVEAHIGWTGTRNELETAGRFGAGLRYSEDEWAARAWVRALVAEPATRAYFLANPELQEEFRRDPLAFVEKHKDEMHFANMMKPENLGPPPKFKWGERTEGTFFTNLFDRYLR